MGYVLPDAPEVIRAEQNPLRMTLSQRKKGGPAGRRRRARDAAPLCVQMAITTVEVGYRPLFRIIETTGDLETDERRRSDRVAHRGRATA